MAVQRDALGAIVRDPLGNIQKDSTDATLVATKAKNTTRPPTKKQIEDVEKQYPITAERLANPELHALTDSAANATGVNPNLIRTIHAIESAARHTSDTGKIVTSSAGARGLGQIMPATAKGLGINADDSVQNVQGTARLFKELSDRFDGDQDKMIAAYNGSPDNVARLIKRHGENWKGFLPEETKNYLTNFELYNAKIEGREPTIKKPWESSDAPVVANIEDIRKKGFTDQPISDRIIAGIGRSAYKIPGAAAATQGVSKVARMYADSHPNANQYVKDWADVGRNQDLSAGKADELAYSDQYGGKAMTAGEYIPDLVTGAVGGAVAGKVGSKLLTKAVQTAPATMATLSRLASKAPQAIKTLGKYAIGGGVATVPFAASHALENALEGKKDIARRVVEELGTGIVAGTILGPMSDFLIAKAGKKIADFAKYTKNAPEITPEVANTALEAGTVKSTPLGSSLAAGEQVATLDKQIANLSGKASSMPAVTGAVQPIQMPTAPVASSTAVPKGPFTPPPTPPTTGINAPNPTFRQPSPIGPTGPNRFAVDMNPTVTPASIEGQSPISIPNTAPYPTQTPTPIPIVRTPGQRELQGMAPKGIPITNRPIASATAIAEPPVKPTVLRSNKLASPKTEKEIATALKEVNAQIKALETPKVTESIPAEETKKEIATFAKPKPKVGEERTPTEKAIDEDSDLSLEEKARAKELLVPPKVVTASRTSTMAEHKPKGVYDTELTKDLQGETGKVRREKRVEKVAKALPEEQKAATLSDIQTKALNRAEKERTKLGLEPRKIVQKEPNFSSFSLSKRDAADLEKLFTPEELAAMQEDITAPKVSPDEEAAFTPELTAKEKLKRDQLLKEAAPNVSSFARKIGDKSKATLQKAEEYLRAPELKEDVLRKLDLEERSAAKKGESKTQANLDFEKGAIARGEKAPVKPVIVPKVVANGKSTLDTPAALRARGEVPKITVSKSGKELSQSPAAIRKAAEMAKPSEKPTMTIAEAIAEVKRQNAPSKTPIIEKPKEANIQNLAPKAVKESASKPIKESKGLTTAKQGLSEEELAHPTGQAYLATIQKGINERAAFYKTNSGKLPEGTPTGAQVEQEARTALKKAQEKIKGQTGAVLNPFSKNTYTQLRNFALGPKGLVKHISPEGERLYIDPRTKKAAMSSDKLVKEMGNIVIPSKGQRGAVSIPNPFHKAPKAPMAPNRTIDFGKEPVKKASQTLLTMEDNPKNRHVPEVYDHAQEELARWKGIAEGRSTSQGTLNKTGKPITVEDAVGLFHTMNSQVKQLSPEANSQRIGTQLGLQEAKKALLEEITSKHPEIGAKLAKQDKLMTFAKGMAKERVSETKYAQSKPASGVKAVVTALVLGKGVVPYYAGRGIVKALGNPLRQAKAMHTVGKITSQEGLRGKTLAAFARTEEEKRDQKNRRNK